MDFIYPRIYPTLISIKSVFYAHIYFRASCLHCAGVSYTACHGQTCIHDALLETLCRFTQPWHRCSLFTFCIFVTASVSFPLLRGGSSQCTPSCGGFCWGGQQPEPRQPTSKGLLSCCYLTLPFIDMIQARSTSMDNQHWRWCHPHSSVMQTWWMDRYSFSGESKSRASSYKSMFLRQEQRMSQ